MNTSIKSLLSTKLQPDLTLNTAAARNWGMIEDRMFQFDRNQQQILLLKDTDQVNRKKIELLTEKLFNQSVKIILSTSSRNKVDIKKIDKVLKKLYKKIIIQNIEHTNEVHRK